MCVNLSRSCRGREVERGRGEGTGSNRGGVRGGKGRRKRIEDLLEVNR